MSSLELKYPIFLAASSFTTDVFWKSLFSNLSKGLPPKSIIISPEGYISCNIKASRFNYCFNKKQAEEVFKDIYGLLTTKLYITSPKDRQSQQANQEKIYSDISCNWNNNWRSIKKKDVKESAIETFALDNKTKYNLSIARTRELYNMINCYQSLKIIEPSDIAYENGIIKHIEGLSFTENDFVFKPQRNIKLKKVKKVDISTYLYQIWDKTIVKELDTEK